MWGRSARKQRTAKALQVLPEAWIEIGIAIGLEIGRERSLRLAPGAVRAWAAAGLAEALRREPAAHRLGAVVSQHSAPAERVPVQPRPSAHRWPAQVLPLQPNQQPPATWIQVTPETQARAVREAAPSSKEFVPMAALDCPLPAAQSKLWLRPVID